MYAEGEDAEEGDRQRDGKEGVRVQGLHYWQLKTIIPCKSYQYFELYEQTCDFSTANIRHHFSSPHR